MTTYSGRNLPSSGSFELYAWFFMRVSGLLLLFLAIGHLVIMHVINNIDQINYQFVANRWVGSWGFFWRTYDGSMLILALIHGLNGLRTILDDFLRPGGRRTLCMALLYVCGFIFLMLGLLTVVTFTPR